MGFFSKRADPGKCNSDKCHCPRCQKSALRDGILLGRLVHDRVEVAVARAMRAERQHGFGDAARHVRKTIVDRREELRIRNMGLEPIDRTYYSREHSCYWKWHRCGVGWRMKNLATRASFGPLYHEVNFTRDGWNDGPMMREQMPARYIEHSETKVVGAISQTVTDRIEFAGDECAGPTKIGANLQAWANGGSLPTGEKPMLSSLQLTILFWRASRPRHTPFPLAHDTMGVVRKTLRDLEVMGLIAFGGEDLEYDLTDRAKVLIDAIHKLPLPVQTPAPWVMPITPL